MERTGESGLHFFRNHRARLPFIITLDLAKANHTVFRGQSLCAIFSRI
jgi:hypothetical protein